jgi:streptogramin lyase
MVCVVHAVRALLKTRPMANAWLVFAALAFVLGVFVPAAAGDPLGTINEFQVPSGAPYGIVNGPDNKLWVTESYGWIYRSTTSGEMTLIALPPDAGFPPDAYGITAGPDGNLWALETGFSSADPGDWIDRVTTEGATTRFALADSASNPSAITVGPDGNLWFTEEGTSRIGLITPAGAISEFSTGITAAAWPQGISVGPDGNLWFVEHALKQVARISTTGDVTEFSDGIDPNKGAQATSPGADGNVWFTQGLAGVARITPAGQVTQFPPATSASGPDAIALGPDGNIWFAASSAGKIARVTPDGTVTDYPVPTYGTNIPGIAPGPDGNMWFTEGQAGRIGRIGTGQPPASVTPPSVVGSGRVGDEHTCEGAQWSTYVGQQPSQEQLLPAGRWQWFRDGAAITGTNADTYVPTTEDSGHQLTCRMTVRYALLALTVSATSPAGPTIGTGASSTPPPVDSPPVTGAVAPAQSQPTPIEADGTQPSGQLAGGRRRTAAPCIVPVLRNKQLRNALRALRRNHCTVSRDIKRFNDSVGRGRVIKSSPRPGLRLKRDETVVLVVSKGPRR